MILPAIVIITTFITGIFAVFMASIATVVGLGIALFTLVFTNPLVACFLLWLLWAGKSKSATQTQSRQILTIVDTNSQPVANELQYSHVTVQQSRFSTIWFLLGLLLLPALVLLLLS